jgi:hypothetical protein
MTINNKKSIHRKDAKIAKELVVKNKFTNVAIFAVNNGVQVRTWLNKENVKGACSPE